MGSNEQIPTYALRDVVETDVLTALSADGSQPSPCHAHASEKELHFPLRLLAFLEEEGKTKLTTGLGVKKIFDLEDVSKYLGHSCAHLSRRLEKIGLGVLSAIILRTAGYSPDTIVHDYVHVLARVGFEPIRESLYNELIGKKDRDEVTTRSILAAGGISYKANGAIPRIHGERI
ncbi:hypothetical protein BDDG_07218 [Blastomyces dermatitidis ATCC 18188]|uniref:Uncharacterized protein n=1 Tax=Ajellomyces dermatitidis (strain ATCC 18188 / CBS 674.68) TaxID=653446 RepID=F2TM10_AJEDA|nr:hypothetical protein BDDG_07218 [Blastomyces dermatitidis ATCC 18188]EQL34080.1 hypothetical protein BDFG_03997 [Blastomyces dermatitidis ATCC 26199]